MLYLSESNANCSGSIKYIAKLVKDFLEEPLEKNSDSEATRLPPHADFNMQFAYHFNNLQS